MTHPLDKENMEQVILNSPQQYLDGLSAAEKIEWKPQNKIERVLLAGMGGSWMAAALLRDAELNNVPINIHRSYGIPENATKNTLFIASSFSGNTEETISAYEAAREKQLDIIGISAGGELEERCLADGIPFVKIPANPPTIQPRCATGYSVGILVGLLEKFGLAKEGATETIKQLADHLVTFMATARERGEKLSPEMVSVTPVIYGDNNYRSVARIWKIKCNENAKTPAFWNFFPELNHNEMCGWTSPHGNFHVIILRDENANPLILKRMEITERLLTEKGIKVSVIPVEGKSKTEKVFSTLLVGDWFSYKLALELGIDPTPVDMVENFKKLLKA
jgi:glucose/mannose-6-phosphate isomerase